MDDEELNANCPSADDHEPDIQQLLPHYLGCLRFDERDRLLLGDHKVWKQKDVKAGTVAEKIIQLKKNIDGQIGRVTRLRSELSCPGPPQGQQNGRCHNPSCLHLVGQVAEGLRAWRDSAKYKEGIQAVQKWYREQNGGATAAVVEPKQGPAILAKPSAAAILNPPPDVSTILNDPSVSRLSLTGRRTMSAPIEHYHASSTARYSLLEDIKAYVIQYERKVSAPLSPGRGLGISSSEPALSPAAATLAGDSHSALPPQVDYFPYNERGSHWKGHFPHQSVNLETALNDKKLFSPPENGHRLRYFHIPVNNMSVSRSESAH
jgi:hypothetical protein